MSSADRLRQLRELEGRLELLPATEERDSMLRKVRARAVDVDTGVPSTPFAVSHTPRRRPDTVDARLAKPACDAPSTGWRSRPSRSRAGDVAATLRSNDVLAPGEVLSLEDLPAPDAPARTRGAWERGLRG
jgi:hypothetical protein